MFNAKTSISAALILSSMLHGVTAQVTTRRRRTSVGGVVAGIVVGCLVLLALLVLCCLLSRRRRRLRNNPAGFGGGPGAGNYNGRTGGRPFFGNGGMFAFGNGKQNYNENQALPQHQQPVGGAQYGYGNHDPNSYAGQNGVGGGGQVPGNASETAPPPYGKEGAGYAPPPGPPPPAHTAGAQNDQFVGGFRT
ncbi:hypothetical protein GGU11DRAFT_747489 [Lentinula aff. detonsa]|nr:hypothetical protein GGU11DRAFT_747489 [Lentinula aff. detonsa]